jgi:hypothetical protein
MLEDGFKTKMLILPKGKAVFYSDVLRWAKEFLDKGGWFYGKNVEVIFSVKFPILKKSECPFIYRDKEGETKGDFLG